MSEGAFWLLISVTVIMIGITLMLIGWATIDIGGWPCVIGLLTICTGVALAGFTKEDKEK